MILPPPLLKFLQTQESNRNICIVQEALVYIYNTAYNFIYKMNCQASNGRVLTTRYSNVEQTERRGEAHDPRRSSRCGGRGRRASYGGEIDFPQAIAVGQQRCGLTFTSGQPPHSLRGFFFVRSMPSGPLSLLRGLQTSKQRLVAEAARSRAVNIVCKYSRSCNMYVLGTIIHIVPTFPTVASPLHKSCAI